MGMGIAGARAMKSELAQGRLWAQEEYKQIQRDKDIFACVSRWESIVARLLPVRVVVDWSIL